MAPLPDFTVSQKDHNMNMSRIVNVPVLNAREFKQLYVHFNY